MHVCVVVGPSLADDHPRIEEIIALECAALGVGGRLVPAASGEEFASKAARHDDCAMVVMPGDGAAAGETIAGHAVWYEPGPIEGMAKESYLYGRGLQGLAWAIRHAVHRRRNPAERIKYGPHHDQWGELRLPDNGHAPAAVLVHGGYWRSVWAADLMDALAVDLVGRGFAVWNLEYRRPDLHGWTATTEDLAKGLAALADDRVAGSRLDLDRVAVIGHSAGGQLALRVAADLAEGMKADLVEERKAEPAEETTARRSQEGQIRQAPRIRLAVSLAGVIDLGEALRRGMGNHAVLAALGGTSAELPDTYAASDPTARLPLGVPLLVVQGRQDDQNLVDVNRRFVGAARAAGDDVVYLDQPGDHFDVIDPASDIWRATAAELTARLRPNGEPPRPRRSRT